MGQSRAGSREKSLEEGAAFKTRAFLIKGQFQLAAGCCCLWPCHVIGLLCPSEAWFNVSKGNTVLF